LRTRSSVFRRAFDPVAIYLTLAVADTRPADTCSGPSWAGRGPRPLVQLGPLRTGAARAPGCAQWWPSAGRDPHRYYTRLYSFVSINRFTSSAAFRLSFLPPNSRRHYRHSFPRWPFCNTEYRLPGLDSVRSRWSSHRARQVPFGAALHQARFATRTALQDGSPLLTTEQPVANRRPGPPCRCRKQEVWRAHLPWVICPRHNSAPRCLHGLRAGRHAAATYHRSNQ